MKNNNERIKSLPSLRVSDHKKRAKEFEYTKDVIDFYIESAYFEDESVIGESRDLYELYEAYNNNLPESYFHYVTNPYNSSNEDYTNWPARLRPYTIIRPNIDLLEGEYEKRPFSYFVKVNNPDAVNVLEDEEYKQMLDTVSQMFINNLNDKNYETGLPSQPTKNIEHILGSYEDLGPRDARALQGQAALDVLIDDLFLEEIFKKLFKDWLIAGEIYSYKNVKRGAIDYERVSPLDIDYDKSPDIDYVEDGQWVVRRMHLTYSDIVDMFYDELKESEHDELEELEGGVSFRATHYNNLFNRLHREEQDLKRGKIEVFHVCFKYKKKIGILTYFNENTLEEEQIEVPETYKPSEDESVEWMWVNEVWEGYRAADDLYFGIRPIQVQRNEMNNFSLK